MPQAATAPPARSKSARPATVLTLLAILPMLACAGMAAWLYLVIAPEATRASGAQRAETARAQAGADLVVVDSLAHAMAGGDYGEVQETLTRIEGTRFLTRAVVTNAANRIVAIAGDPAGARVGEPAVDLPPGGRRLALASGGRALGQLLILAAPEALPDNSARIAADLRAVALLTAVFALLSAIAISWLWWERRNAARAARAPAAPRPLAETATTVLQARLERPPADAGPGTLQDIEAELRKRVAVSRERRGFPNSVMSDEPRDPPR